MHKKYPVSRLGSVALQQTNQNHTKTEWPSPWLCIVYCFTPSDLNHAAMATSWEVCARKKMHAVHSSVKKMQWWDFVYLPPLLCHPHLVFILLVCHPYIFLHFFFFIYMVLCCNKFIISSHDWHRKLKMEEDANVTCKRQVDPRNFTWKELSCSNRPHNAHEAYRGKVISCFAQPSWKFAQSWIVWCISKVLYILLVQYQI